MSAIYKGEVVKLYLLSSEQKFREKPDGEQRRAGIGENEKIIK